MSNFVRILPIFFISFSLNSIHCQTLKSNVPSKSISEANEYLQSICGQSDIESTNDNKTADLKPGEYPWLVPIYKKSKVAISYICTGSLISARTILTAAHCFDEPSLTAAHLAYLGRYNLSDWMETNNLLREINSLVIHPEFKSGLGFSDADIALLQMLEPVSFTKFIRPICLWSEPSDSSLIVGTSGIVAGWGAIDFLSPVPKKCEQNIVSDGDCLRPGHYSITSQRTLCAFQPDGVGPCGGDPGDGLIFYRNGRWILRAVASAGLTRDGHYDLSEYVVYCDIAQHIPWVLSSMLT